MKRKRFFNICIPFCLLAALLAGCGTGADAPEQETQPSGTLIGTPLAEKQAADDLFSLCYSPDESVNPFSGGSALNAQLAALMYEPLFSVAADFSFTPTRLITEYETTDGGQSWVFGVNTQVRFSDGTALSASDVVYSIRRAMQSPRYRARLDNYSVIFGISELDEASFMVTLHQANMLFPALLSFPILRSGDYGTACPVGTGLYMMEGAELWNGTPDAKEGEAQEDEAPAEIPTPKLVVNPLHPDAKKTALREIYLREYVSMEQTVNDFEDGLIDLMENDPTGISALGFSSANEVRSYLSPSMYFLGFNAAHEFVFTAQYRYAMNFLIDRKTIVDKLMLGNGAAAVSPIAPTSPYYDDSIDSVVHYAPQSALDALARGGCEDYDDDGKLEYMVTGIPMEIDLDFVVSSNTPVKVSIARQIAEELRAVGISVTLHELPWEDYLIALDEGEFDLYLGEVMLTADFNLSALLTEDGSLNYGGFNDAGYAARIAAYLAADDASRAAACSDMCQYIVANSPIIPIAFENREVVTHRGAVSGIELSPYNIFRNIADWKVSLYGQED